MWVSVRCGDWSRNAPKRDVGGHFDGYTSRKGTDLLMYVHEESVGFPASHLLNGGGADSIEKHGHGSTGAEGVTADIAWVITKF